MSLTSLALVFSLAFVPPPATPTPASPSATFIFPPFGPIRVFEPVGAPRSMVIFVSGDGGFNLGVIPMAQRLAAEGALVAGVDIGAYRRGIAATRGCAFTAGHLEELARATQLGFHVKAYLRPILVGYSSGATLVYGALGQAPLETFAGGISLGFCPDLDIGPPLCKGRGLVSTPHPRLGFDLGRVSEIAPWAVLQGQVDQVCDPKRTSDFVTAIQGAELISLPKVGHGFGVTRNWEGQFVAAFQKIAANKVSVASTISSTASEPAKPRPDADLASELGLEVVEPRSPQPSKPLVVLATGDGGWAGIDKALAIAFAEAGLPTVGWSSLTYYWQPKTPEIAAKDLARILNVYMSKFARRDVILVGYSFGADVLPFLYNRLSAEHRSRVRGLALVSPSRTAAFEFHMAGWLGFDSETEYAVGPEIKRSGVRTICVSGESDEDRPCENARSPNAETVVLPGGHHLDGDYARIATEILRRFESDLKIVTAARHSSSRPANDALGRASVADTLVEFNRAQVHVLVCEVRVDRNEIGA